MNKLAVTFALATALLSGSLVATTAGAQGVEPAANSLASAFLQARAERLTNDTIALAIRSARTRYFEGFRKAAAQQLQAIVTAEKIGQTFDSLGLAKLDSAPLPLVGKRPVFSSVPSIGREGRLMSEGRYVLDAASLEFKLEFMLESGDWKPVFVWLNVVRHAPAAVAKLAVPGEAETARLVNETMSLFITSVQAKSMAPLYDGSSRLMRQQVSLAAMNKAFVGFLKLDLANDPLLGLQPVFTAVPSLNGQGVLAVRGVYPSQTEATAFQITFVNEGGAWKLLGLTVNVQPLARPAAAAEKKSIEA